MWAYRLRAPLMFERVQVAAPDPARLAGDDLVVRLLVGGICGSDLPEARGLLVSRSPTGIGPLHEIVGEVVGCASGRYTVGQRVVGWAKDQHALAERLIMSELEVWPVPDAMSDIEAVVAQPLACVLCAVERLGVQVGPGVAARRVAVVGQGPTGLLFDHVLARRGAQVTGIDPVDRSALATAMGAEFVHASSRDWARSVDGGAGSPARPEIVVEAVGHQVGTLNDALLAVAPLGQVYAFGVNDEPYYPLDMQRLMRKHLALRAGGTVNHASYLAQALAYLAEHPDLAGTLVTAVLPLHPPDQGFRKAVSDDHTRGKVVLVVDA